MAYVDQSKKAKIAANLKKVVPAGWKYSLAVRHHSTIVMTISSAPINLLAEMNGLDEGETYARVNHHYIDNRFRTEELVKTFREIAAALNTDNYDHSDPMTDYYNVGHYVEISVGRWDKPFVVKA